MDGVLIFIGLVGFVILIRIFLHSIDKSNISDAASAKGWTNVDIRWAPFAPGFFFEKGERHYYVTYTNKDGKRGGRYCKTSLLTGVFWRDESS